MDRRAQSGISGSQRWLPAAGLVGARLSFRGTDNTGERARLDIPVGEAVEIVVVIQGSQHQTQELDAWKQVTRDRLSGERHVLTDTPMEVGVVAADGSKMDGHLERGLGGDIIVGDPAATTRDAAASSPQANIQFECIPVPPPIEIQNDDEITHRGEPRDLYWGATPGMDTLVLRTDGYRAVTRWEGGRHEIHWGRPEITALPLGDEPNHATDEAAPPEGAGATA